MKAVLWRWLDSLLLKILKKSLTIYVKINKINIVILIRIQLGGNGEYERITTITGKKTSQSG